MARALLERRYEIGARGTDRRYEPEGNAGADGDQQRVQHHAPVRRNGKSDIDRQRRLDAADDGSETRRERERQRTADERQHETLRHQLARDS